VLQFGLVLLSLYHYHKYNRELMLMPRQCTEMKILRTVRILSSSIKTHIILTCPQYS
jgi:hypothetical protein